MEKVDTKAKTTSDPLTYKVLKLSGLSIFCDWEGIDEIGNGAIDLEKLSGNNAV